MPGTNLPQIRQFLLRMGKWILCTGKGPIDEVFSHPTRLLLNDMGQSRGGG
jgi:hypothetical protein